MAEPHISGDLPSLGSDLNADFKTIIGILGIVWLSERVWVSCAGPVLTSDTKHLATDNAGAISAIEIDSLYRDCDPLRYATHSKLTLYGV